MPNMAMPITVTMRRAPSTVCPGGAHRLGRLACVHRPALAGAQAADGGRQPGLCHGRVGRDRRRPGPAPVDPGHARLGDDRLTNNVSRLALCRVWTLPVALNEPARLLPKEATMPSPRAVADCSRGGPDAPRVVWAAVPSQTRESTMAKTMRILCGRWRLVSWSCAWCRRSDVEQKQWSELLPSVAASDGL